MRQNGGLAWHAANLPNRIRMTSQAIIPGRTAQFFEGILKLSQNTKVNILIFSFHPLCKAFSFFSLFMVESVITDVEFWLVVTSG